MTQNRFGYIYIDVDSKSSKRPKQTMRVYSNFAIKITGRPRVISKDRYATIRRLVKPFQYCPEDFQTKA